MKRLAALLLSGALLVSGCGGAKPDGGKTDGSLSITIASMSPLSGSSASQGESIRYGAELALQDRAAELEKAGFKASFLAMDDQGKPEQGTQLAEQLLTRKDVVALIGTLNSGVAIPVSQKLSADGLVMVSPANTATQVTDRRLPNVDRIVARDDMQGPAAARFIKENLKATSLFIIHDKTAYGQGLADEVKKAAEANGLKVDGFEGINLGEKDFGAVLSKVEAAGSPAVFFGGLYAEAAQMVKQMRDKAITAKFVGGDGIDSGELIKLAGEAANGVYFTSVVRDIQKTPEGQSFTQKYAEFAKKPMDSYAAYAYDATQLVINALIDYSKTNPGKMPGRKELAQLIRKTSGFKGLAGTVTFDDKGDNKDARVYVYQIQNSQYPGVQIQ